MYWEISVTPALVGCLLCVASVKALSTPIGDMPLVTAGASGQLAAVAVIHKAA